MSLNNNSNLHLYCHNVHIQYCIKLFIVSGRWVFRTPLYSTLDIQRLLCCVEQRHPVIINLVLWGTPKLLKSFTLVYKLLWSNTEKWVSIVMDFTDWKKRSQFTGYFLKDWQSMQSLSYKQNLESLLPFGHEHCNRPAGVNKIMLFS